SLDQHRRQVVHLEDHFSDAGITLCGLAFRVADYFVHCRVSHSLPAVNDRWRKSVINYTTVSAKLNQSGHRQTIHSRLERANIGGEPLREHRNRAFGEVHGCSSPEGFLIEGAAFAHVITDVRNVNSE